MKQNIYTVHLKIARKLTVLSFSFFGAVVHATSEAMAHGWNIEIDHVVCEETGEVKKGQLIFVEDEN